MAILKIVMFRAVLNRHPIVRDISLYFISSSCEVSVVIIAACIPTIMPLFEVLRGDPPMRFNSTERTWWRRIRFGKGSSYTSYQRNPQYAHKPIESARFAMILDGSEGWGKNGHVETNVSVAHGHFEGNRGIQVTRQIDVQEHSRNRIESHV